MDRVNGGFFFYSAGRSPEYWEAASLLGWAAPSTHMDLPLVSLWALLLHQCDLCWAKRPTVVHLECGHIMCCIFITKGHNHTVAEWLSPSAFNHWKSEETQVQKKKVRSHTHTPSPRTCLKRNLKRSPCCWLWWWRRRLSTGDGWRFFFFLLFSQTLDQDLWVAGDRSKEEGVPSRFGRGTGMCPLIRLGNCGGRERGLELVRGGGGTAALSLLWFPVFNSCNIHCTSSSLSPSSTTGEAVNIGFWNTEPCVCLCVCERECGVCVCFCMISQMRSSSQTSPPCSDWLPWAQTGSIHRISSPSQQSWNRTPLLDLLTQSQPVSPALKSLLFCTTTTKHYFF